MEGQESIGPAEKELNVEKCMGSREKSPLRNR